MSAPCAADCECDGRCCAVFYFPRTPREIDELVEVEGRYNGADGRMLSDMLVPLTLDEARERAAKFHIEDPRTWDEDTSLYTCRHWDEETRLCTVYDHRPGMCSGYPYGKACTHCGSTEGSSEDHSRARVELGRE